MYLQRWKQCFQFNEKVKILCAGGILSGSVFTYHEWGPKLDL